jgi:MFS family permease
VVNPVMPVFAASFGVNEFAAAAVIAAFALMRLVFAPAVGPLADRLGLRSVLISGVMIVAVSSLAVGFAASYAQMIVLRGLGGIGSAMFSVTAMTVLLGSVGPSWRGRASALYQGAFLVGAVAGPAVGGLFGAISLRAPFFFYAGTLTIAAVVALGLEPISSAADSPGNKTADGAASSTARPLRQVIRDRRYQAALLAHLAQGWNTNGTRSSLIPLFVGAYLASDPATAVLWAGIAMSIAAAVQIVVIGPAGWIVDRYGRRGPMVGGAVVAAAAMAVLPFSRSLALLTALLSLYAVGAALIGTAPTAAVGDAAGPGGARAIALYSMAGDTGSVVGPLVAGYLAAEFSYVAACAVGAALWLASGGLSLLMPRGPRPGSSGKT